MTEGTELTRQLVPVSQTLPTISEIRVMAQLANNFKGLAGVLFPRELDTPAKALAVMEAGRELGAPPMVSFQHMFLVNGKVQPDGQLMEAVVRARDPSADFEIERSAERCKITLKRGTKHPVTLECTIADVPSQIKGKGPWATYTADMLFWFTMKRVCRMGAADLINAVSGIAVEEAGELLEDVNVVEGEARLVDEPDTPPPPKQAAIEQSPGKARSELKKALTKRFGDDEQSTFEFVQATCPDACEGTTVDYSKVSADACERMIAGLETPAKQGELV